MLHYEWNQLAEANHIVQQAIILAERSGNIEVQGTGYRNLSLVKQAMGEEKASLVALEKAVNCVGKSVPPIIKGRNAAAYVKVFLSQGNLDAAKRFAQNMFPAAASSFYPRLHLAPARIFLAEGDKVSAAAHLKGQYTKASLENWGYGKIEIRLLQALAAPNPTEAITLLSEALVMSQPEGFIRIFLDKGKV